MAELVQVKSFLDADRANLAASALGAAGIPVKLSSDDCAGCLPTLSAVGVEVPESAAIEAREILTKPVVTSGSLDELALKSGTQNP